MKPNPLLEKLGFSKTDRLVIIHADDIGMCHASVQAFKDLWRAGTITSGATMVPCAWFPAVTQMCRENPDMDMGVHVTLNAEWTNFRWGPVSTRDQASGLMDADGYFHLRREAVYQHARPEAVEMEVNAQIEQALAAEIDVTHVDSHMGTVMNPRFIQSYTQAASRRLLPNMLLRPDAIGIEMMVKDMIAYSSIMNMLEAVNIPTLNGIMMMPLDQPNGQLETAKKMLGGLPGGITHFLLHPSVDTPELRTICPDWESRVENYKTFKSDDLKKFIESENIKLIGYRAIRETMRKP